MPGYSTWGSSTTTTFHQWTSTGNTGIHAGMPMSMNPAKSAICKTCGHPVPERDWVEHADLHADATINALNTP